VSVSFVLNIMFEIAGHEVLLGRYKPHTGRYTNHSLAILAAPALIIQHASAVSCMD